MMPDPSKEVPAFFTRWATPWDHHEIIVNMDGILRSCGVLEAHVRRRMTINAIIASGWRQAVWNHNAFGVQLGRGQGLYYRKGSEEDTGGGVMVKTPRQPWRSFNSWSEAVDDWLDRQHAGSGFYGKSSQMLRDPAISDGAWWEEHSVHYSTTTTHDHVADGNSIGNRVKRELAGATPEELEKAASITVGKDILMDASTDLAPIIVAAPMAGIAAWLAVKYPGVILPAIAGGLGAFVAYRLVSAWRSS